MAICERVMSSAEKVHMKMTASEHAAWEREPTERHESCAGEVFSQARGTRRHSLIGTNTARAIGNLLNGQACCAH